ncbi:MAG: hypothetical protein KZQ95_16490 [Candidatus Thiodiazotropha sp. (ex Epidulcina cf. delphinae)]|nr:hypothetical protein [Candidatus Thiodiazotropha sp. (ex Epidulcina cf. delphinae)]
MQINKLVARFKRAIIIANHKQKDVVNTTGLGQYQVSRIINGQFVTLNKSVQKLCNYADIILGPSDSSKQRIEEELISSVLDLWDGSIIDGESIVGLLERLKRYRQNAVEKSATPKCMN